LGVPLVLAVLAGLAFLCYRRGKKSAKRAVGESQGIDERLYQEPESLRPYREPQSVQEMADEQKRSEMPSENYSARAELAANGNRGRY